MNMADWNAILQNCWYVGNNFNAILYGATSVPHRCGSNADALPFFDIRRSRAHVLLHEHEVDPQETG